MNPSVYDESVFINCPFDADYLPFFNAVIFSVFDCGYRARCSKEIDDSGQVRIDKIFKIISECKFGLHDISRTDLDPESGLPRFNMPFELGVFLGAKRFGNPQQHGKNCLILDKDSYRYQSFMSDIAGQDIEAHDGEPEKVISIVRNWLNSSSEDVVIPGGKEIVRRYRIFGKELPDLCARIPIDLDELTYNDYTSFISAWLRENAQF